MASCAVQAGESLADVFSLKLDYDAPTGGGTAQYNGNISNIQWRTYIGTTCLAQQQYRFTYDYANRLTAASHYTHNGTSWIFTNNYTESGISYDLNGNIKTYTRRGLTAPATFGVIDQLTYTYGDATRPDRLTQVADAGSATKGFVYNPAAAAYQYDNGANGNGNMTQDNHKGFAIQYNYLNLPIVMTKGASVITMTYTADGEKLTKAVTGGGATKNYVGGIEYSGASLEAVYHGEGRCRPNGTTAFFYEYTVKDHLGNARVNFQANGAAIANIEDHHYYPFGMKMEGIGSSTATNKYTYNYKELNEDFGLNWHDYGARWYDAAVGRWWSVDPLAEPQANYSPYAYTYNNPLAFVDPTGMMGESADGMSNDQWLDRTRKDGGYWEQAKKEMTIKDSGQQEVQDENGKRHQVGSRDMKKTRSTAYGTRIETKGGVVLSDRIEGYYVEAIAEEPAICPPCIVIIVAILATAPEVATNSTGNHEADAKAIQEARKMRDEWLLAGVTAPVRAEGYAAQGVGKILKLTASQSKAIRSFEKRIAEHKEKLSKYLENPLSFDNIGYLQNAVNNTERQQRIIEGRVKHLESEIRKFQNEIDKILNSQ